MKKIMMALALCVLTTACDKSIVQFGGTPKLPPNLPPVNGFLIFQGQEGGQELPPMPLLTYNLQEDPPPELPPLVPQMPVKKIYGLSSTGEIVVMKNPEGQDFILSNNQYLRDIQLVQGGLLFVIETDDIEHSIKTYFSADAKTSQEVSSSISITGSSPLVNGDVASANGNNYFCTNSGVAKWSSSSKTLTQIIDMNSEFVFCEMIKVLDGKVFYVERSRDGSSSNLNSINSETDAVLGIHFASYINGSYRIISLNSSGSYFYFTTSSYSPVIESNSTTLYRMPKTNLQAIQIHAGIPVSPYFVEMSIPEYLDHSTDIKVITYQYNPEAIQQTTNEETGEETGYYTQGLMMPSLASWTDTYLSAEASFVNQMNINFIPAGTKTRVISSRIHRNDMESESYQLSYISSTSGDVLYKGEVGEYFQYRGSAKGKSYVSVMKYGLFQKMLVVTESSIEHDTRFDFLAEGEPSMFNIQVVEVKGQVLFIKESMFDGVEVRIQLLDNSFFKIEGINNISVGSGKRR